MYVFAYVLFERIKTKRISIHFYSVFLCPGAQPRVCVLFEYAIKKDPYFMIYR